MAKRRMISQELVFDEEFNTLSFEAQSLFIRMLAISDDCGVVPGSLMKLRSMVNLPTWKNAKLKKHLEEILSMNLGIVVEYEGKQYYIFKVESFMRYQSYIINKRLFSEYLKMDADTFDSINWEEMIVNCESIDNHMTGNWSPSTVESRKKKVESRKQKVTAIEEQVPLPGGLNTAEVVNAWDEFKQHRKEIKKKVTQRAEKMMLKRLLELSEGNPHKAVKILEQSIANSWQGIFELKGAYNGTNQQNNRRNAKAGGATTRDDLERTFNKIFPEEGSK